MLIGLSTRSPRADGHSLGALVIPAIKEVITVAIAKGYFLAGLIASNSVMKGNLAEYIGRWKKGVLWFSSLGEE